MDKEKLFAGIDIGGTNTALGLISSEGRVLQESSFSTQKYEQSSAFLGRLIDEIEQLLALMPGEFALSGIGAAAPMANFFRGTIESPANLNWGEVAFVKIMQNHFKVKTVITNDGNAAALEEMVFGVAKGMKNFIVLTLGTGLGCGIILNGEIYYGTDGLAGELGHIIVEPGGRDCACGRAGCLETYVSATGICRSASMLMAQKQCASVLHAIPPAVLTAEKIARAADRGDALAGEVFAFTGAVLGPALANLAVIFNPEAIILFGGLAKAGDLLLKPTIDSFRQNSLNIYKREAQVLMADMQDGHSAIRGAAALVNR